MSRLVLIIPELWAPLLSGQVRAAQLPALANVQRLLSRAHQIREEVPGYYSLLCRLFDLELASGSSLPQAALSYLSDFQSAQAGWYLRVDPVHLQIGRDKLMLQDNHQLRVTEEEAAQLITSINEFWHDQGLEVQQGAPGRWYLYLEEDPQLQTYSLQEAVGRNIQPYLMQGAARQRWQALMNEVQMLLHTSPVNAAREAQRRPSINSVWLWGEGSLSQLQSAGKISVPRRVYSDDPVATGLAKRAGAEVFTLPDDSSGLLQSDANAEILVVMHWPAEMLAHGDIGQWLEWLLQFNSVWAHALIGAVADNVLKEITVYIPGENSRGYHYRLTPKLLSRWWRRNLSLADIIS